ncbi:MAG: biotin--[acetyl-CoA-carboxylase] ligase [Clostridia bacterium]|nr:biotin--[acetyl-CoA-carboxylase] ligase [Clostridia bacterium]
MKTKILKMLKENENKFVSGKAISEALNISRQAVSKHISHLKDEGYHIESISRRGHCYRSDAVELYNQMELTRPTFKSDLGKELIFLETIDSTNEYLKKNAFKLPHGTVVISDEQTKGKGRLGRVWESQSQTGIWMSILLKPEIPPYDAPKITQIAGAAMVLTLRAFGFDVKIKWPNDLILDKKKVCGVLTEMSAELGEINYVVVGIGVNVHQKNFPDEIRDKATSLSLHTDQMISRKNLILRFFDHFENLYLKFIEEKSLKETIMICKEHSILIGEKVKLITKSSVREVYVEDLDEEGQLVVMNENNEKEKVFYGEVSVRGLYDYVN